MKNHLVVSSLLTSFTLGACSTNQYVEDRTPAADTAAYQNANVSFQVQVNTIDYCGKKFDQVEVVSSNPGVMVYSKMVKQKGLKFEYPVPASVQITRPETAEVIARAKGVAADLVIAEERLNNPIFPSIPILPKDREKEVCPALVKYHQSFSKLQAARKLRSSKILKLNGGYATINLVELKKYVAAEAVKVNKVSAELAARPGLPPTDIAAPNFLIYFDEQYRRDVEKLAGVHNQLGYRTKIIALSELPGYRAQDPIPAECAGDFTQECYHFKNDQAVGLSQNAVIATKGMVNEIAITQNYEKIPYVPGLIRASIRAQKKLTTIKGVLLIGNPDKLPGFYSIMDGNVSYPVDWDKPEASFANKLHTDLYYMLPDVALVPNGFFSHESINPGLWMCDDGQGHRTYRVWCLNNEARAWPAPPLTVLRWSPIAPTSRILKMKNSPWSAAILAPEDMAKISLKDIIPVGRIVTHENYNGAYDTVVANYADKMLRWHRELPSMTGNSIQSNGGSTGDTWIFLDSDITQFKATYGANSSIYGSEFFVPLTKCQGSCVYQNGVYIHSQLRNKNRVAFHINGHGGHIAVQAPFGNGNVESAYLSENIFAMDGAQRLQKIKYPTDNTVKVLENGGLVGHVFANSCDLSNFNLDSSWHKMMLQQDPTTDVRSLAEQWLNVKNGGALNVYTNSDVGWGYSDNNYNVKFMSKVAQAQAQCGTIGDALRLTVYDMIQGLGAGAGDWQVVNRQFLGSPVNRIAKLPINCYRTTPVPNVETGVSSQ